jgi:hypothetical protein
MFAYLHYNGVTIFTTAILSFLLICDPYTYFEYLFKEENCKSYNAHKNLWVDSIANQNTQVKLIGAREGRDVIKNESIA